MRKSISSRIEKVTLGALNSLVNIVLLEIKLLGHIAGGEKITMRNLQRVLDEELGIAPKYSVRRALTYAREMGLTNKHGTLTQAGEEKLRKKLPSYKPITQWQGDWTFVAFDIQEKIRFKRNILRAYLQKWKFGKLQNSVWVSVRDATQELTTLCETYHIVPPCVLFWKAKSVGMNSKQAAEYIWNLQKLNQRYEEYIKEYRRGIDAFAGIFVFLAIAQDDPQLPPELLPPHWNGEEAFRLYQKFLRFRSATVS